MVQTVDTFDLVSWDPARRNRVRRAYRASGLTGARSFRTIDKRPVFVFEVVLAPARMVELRRLAYLWRVTGEGVLPMDYPESVHKRTGEGDYVVVFDEPRLERSFANGGSGAATVRLRTWR